MRWLLFLNHIKGFEGQIILFGPGKKSGSLNVWSALPGATDWLLIVDSQEGAMWNDVMSKIVGGEGVILLHEPTLGEARQWFPLTQ